MSLDLKFTFTFTENVKNVKPVQFCLGFQPFHSEVAEGCIAAYFLALQILNIFLKSPSCSLPSTKGFQPPTLKVNEKAARVSYFVNFL